MKRWGKRLSLCRVKLAKKLSRRAGTIQQRIMGNRAIFVHEESSAGFSQAILVVTYEGWLGLGPQSYFGSATHSTSHFVRVLADRQVRFTHILYQLMENSYIKKMKKATF